MLTVKALAIIVLFIGGGAILCGFWIAVVLLTPQKVRRFSLRELLVATTVIAVALGLGAWLAS